MFSRQARARSVASRLVFLFSFAAAFLLASSLGVFYWLVVRHTFEEDNAVLADKVSVLGAELKQSGNLKGVKEGLETSHTGEHAAYWIRVLDSTGHVVMETPGMDSLLPQNVFPGSQADISAVVNPTNYRVRSQLFSLVAVIENLNGQEYTIQVAQDRSADEKFQKEFGTLFATVLAVGVIASIGIARTATRRGLKPLSEITRTIGRIRPSRLSERVAPIGWPPELQPLAEAFDEMLGRLEDSFTRLSQFSADLAHELRTPIANILGEAQVALTRERPAEEYREVIESTVAECERLSRIVENLLFVARAESAREQIKRTQFEGRAAIEKIANYYQTIAEERHVTVECEGEAQINADPVLFSRAISNLVDNALRFTHDGGTIRLSVAAGTQETQVTVSDTGSGIAAEHLPRVFDRFYRADSSRSSAGAGLGLALVKSIAELHGGSARIESTVGQGTTVSLTFPDSA
jgi:two-component system, OmpR family, heavy metal sensor histidine kinase CusS